MSITNWKQKFPITLGNEQTGERPWLGSIAELWVTDYALKFKETKAILDGQSPNLLQQDHLVAFYQLGDQGSGKDQSGNLSDLIWQGPTSGDQTALGSFSRSDSWLQTAQPATRLIKKLKQENQFSFGVKFQARSLEQDGPARLVSLAKDTSDWNFMLGQENKSLVFRLHMLFTENGNYVDPQVRFPRVFVDTLPHQVVITYTGELIQIYVDSARRRRSFELTPIFVMSKLQNLWFSDIDSSNIRLYRYLYYFTFFAPLAAILGVFTVLCKKNIQTFLLASIGFILPPVALQYAFMGNEWQRSNQDNLRLSLLMMVIIIIAINVFSRLRKKR
ncbi:hypothetical protein [Acaryochloris thomasi]|nr:hypothetical protein [Acaryochloris thomasi]